MQVQGYIHLCKQKSSRCRICSCYQSQTFFFHVRAKRANESRKCGVVKASLVWNFLFSMLEWRNYKGVGKFILCVWANMNNSCRFLCEISNFNEREWWKNIFSHDLILNILIDPILGMFKNSSKQKMIRRIKPKMKLEVNITLRITILNDNPIKPIPLSNTSSPKSWSTTLLSGEGFNPCFKVKLMSPHHWFTSKMEFAEPWMKLIDDH